LDILNMEMPRWGKNSINPLQYDEGQIAISLDNVMGPNKFTINN